MLRKTLLAITAILALIAAGCGSSAETADTSSGDAAAETADTSSGDAAAETADTSSDDAAAETADTSSDDAAAETADTSSDDAAAETADMSSDDAAAETADMSSDDAATETADMSSDDAATETADTSSGDAAAETADTSTASSAADSAGSISQGAGTTVVENMFTEGTRPAEVGEIVSSDGVTWTVPAATNYQNDAVPFAADLYNDYGLQFGSVEEAVAALDESSIVTIDEGGELITAYVFADNYFEMYINGQIIAKDAVPFTWFNSHVVQFRVERPFTIAMQLVDWEENLGLGSESGPDGDYTTGDGGVAAAFFDDAGDFVTTTSSDWKAQTYYISPVTDTSCVVVSDGLRDSSGCSSDASSDGSQDYAFHWAFEDGWADEDFDDSSWPNASIYDNDTIGVNNKPAFTDFPDIFDNSENDAEFIWSSNIVLDNSVLVRTTVN